MYSSKQKMISLLHPNVESETETAIFSVFFITCNRKRRKNSKRTVKELNYWVIMSRTDMCHN